MKIIIQLLFFFMLINCSFNKNSKFWNENTDKRTIVEQKVKKIIEKADNPMSMTFDEFQIFIDDYTKKSKYPDITQ